MAYTPLLFVVMINFANPNAMNRSVILEPTSPLPISSNDVTFSVLKSDGYTFVENAYWRITNQDNIGFHLHLSLNNSWSFHPSHITNIQIEIEARNLVSDLVLSFSQLSNTYITTMIDGGQTPRDHLIYPQCQISPNKSSTAHGNVKANVNVSTAGTIQQKAMNNTDFHLLPHNQQSSPSSPLTFILQNNPQNDTLSLTFDDNTAVRTCYYEAMTANVPLDIYMATNVRNDIFYIDSIALSYWIEDATVSPSDTSTDPPSAAPTAEPTEEPNIEPTNTGTNITNTHLPSPPPVLITTDSIFTTDVTNESSSVTPTFESSEFPTLPPDQSELPTKLPAENNNNSNVNDMDSTLIIIGAIAVLFCILICCIAWFLVRKKRKNIEKSADSMFKTHQHYNNPENINDRKNNKLRIAMTSVKTESDHEQNSEFDGNLNNLQAANNLLMDDIVDEMENGDMNDGITAGGGDEDDVDPLDMDDDDDGHITAGNVMAGEPNVEDIRKSCVGIGEKGGYDENEVIQRVATPDEIKEDEFEVIDDDEDVLLRMETAGEYNDDESVPAPPPPPVPNANDNDEGDTLGGDTAGYYE